MEYTTIVDQIINAIFEGRDITVTIDGKEIVLDKEEKKKIINDYY